MITSILLEAAGIDPNQVTNVVWKHDAQAPWGTLHITLVRRTSDGNGLEFREVELSGRELPLREGALDHVWQ